MIEQVVILGLVTFRLARLLAIDDGPGDVFLRLRVTMGGYDLGPNREPVTSRGKMSICPHCWGIYIASILALTIAHDPIEFVIVALAIAGLQSFLQSLGG